MEHALGLAGDVLVVIVNFNTRDHLGECLQSLLHDCDCHEQSIVVVDNCSSDGSAELVRNQHPAIQLLQLPENRGFAAGANAGIGARASRFALLLNADTRCRAGGIRALYEYMMEHDDVDVAGPRLVDPDGSLQYSCRRFYTLSAILFRRTILGRLWPDHHSLREHLMTDLSHDELCDVDWLVGGCMMIRTRAWQELGGLDERFFLYFEDTDLCRSTWERGRRISYVPSATFVHYYQQGSRARFGGLRLRYHHLKSGIKYFAKWKLTKSGRH